MEAPRIWLESRQEDSNIDRLIIVKSTRDRRQNWRDHVKRINDQRLVKKISMDDQKVVDVPEEDLPKGGCLNYIFYPSHIPLIKLP